MDIHISHHEDRPKAGYAVEVRFHDRGIPPLRFSAPTWNGVFLHLEHLLEGRHASSMPSRTTCVLCRQAKHRPPRKG